jgi:hypothetical protein
VDCKEGLQELWKRSGIKTKEGFARKIGLPRSTSLMRYLPGGEYRGKTLPDHIVDGLVKNITRTGSPPVTLDEILDLSGISALTSTEHSRSVVGHNAAMATGCYIPVISIGDAIMYEEKEGEARVLSPIKHMLSDRPLDGDEFSIELPDNSMSPKFPAGALAIVKPLGEGMSLAPGQLACVDTPTLVKKSKTTSLLTTVSQITR